MLLKISVLASGVILLDGEPVELDALEKALKDAKEHGLVWYYRQAVSAEPPSQALKVIHLILENKLKVSFSSKPDFSDYVDTKGVSHPRKGKPVAPPNTELHMPDVETSSDIEEIFARVRKTAAREKSERGLVIVRPDRRFMVLPVMPKTPASRTMVANMERLISSAVKRSIAAIGDTVIPTQKPLSATETPSLADASRSIPFLGILIGLTYIGHAVWVFEGHPSALAAGCRDADVLIVDSGMRPFLAPGWEEVASGVMRNPNILLHDRRTFKLSAIRKAGQNPILLEFPN